MTKVMHLQTIQSEEYGKLKCYGLVCKQTDYYLSNMKIQYHFHTNILLLYPYLAFLGNIYPKKQHHHLRVGSIFCVFTVLFLKNSLWLITVGILKRLQNFQSNTKRLLLSFHLLSKTMSLLDLEKRISLLLSLKSIKKKIIASRFKKMFSKLSSNSLEINL